MFKTGDEAYEYRQSKREERLARERQEEEARRQAGEALSVPLSVVPELDRCAALRAGDTASSLAPTAAAPISLLFRRAHLV
jgi:hypothetical protein